MVDFIHEIHSRARNLGGRSYHDSAVPTPHRIARVLSKVLIGGIGGLLLLPSIASAAIAYDTGIFIEGPASSPSYKAATLSASDNAMTCTTEGSVSGTDSTTGVYLGTSSGTSTFYKIGGLQTPSDRYVDLWGVRNMPTGNVTLEVTWSSYVDIYCAAYSGVGSIDATSTNSSTLQTTFAISSTPATTGAWIVAGVRNSGRPVTAGTGTTVRTYGQVNTYDVIADSNAGETGGSSYTLNFNNSTASIVNWAGVSVALEPASAPAAVPTTFSQLFSWW